MFYSDNVLSRKGPLANLWLAAHYEKKLSKLQITSTDIPASIRHLIETPTAEAEFPAQTADSEVKVPVLALRLKGQLLLGLVKIYTRQTKYLLEDCSELLAKIRSAQLLKLSKLVPDAAMSGSSQSSEGGKDSKGKSSKNSRAHSAKSVLDAAKDENTKLDEYFSIKLSQQKGLLAPSSPFKSSAGVHLNAYRENLLSRREELSQEEKDALEKYELLNFDNIKAKYGDHVLNKEDNEVLESLLASQNQMKKRKLQQERLASGDQASELGGGKGNVTPSISLDYGIDGIGGFEDIHENFINDPHVPQAADQSFELARRHEPGQESTLGPNYDDITRFSPMNMKTFLQQESQAQNLSHLDEANASFGDISFASTTVALNMGMMDPSLTGVIVPNDDSNSSVPDMTTIPISPLISALGRKRKNLAATTPEGKRRPASLKLALDSKIQISGEEITNQLKNSDDILKKAFKNVNDLNDAEVDNPLAWMNEMPVDFSKEELQENHQVPELPYEESFMNGLHDDVMVQIGEEPAWQDEHQAFQNELQTPSQYTQEPANAFSAVTAAPKDSSQLDIVWAQYYHGKSSPVSFQKEILPAILAKSSISSPQNPCKYRRDKAAAFSQLLVHLTTTTKQIKVTQGTPFGEILLQAN